MKPIVLFILFIALSNFIQGQNITPCLTDGIELTSQSQIDNFPVDYPGCNTIEGNVKISGNDIVNLSGLIQIQTIKGNLEITDNTLLQRLNGIEQLDSIYGFFIIRQNASLQNIDALDSLKFSGSTITISENDNVTAIESFENLSYLGGGLRIIYNDILTTISGFQKIPKINGNFSLAENPVLTSINDLHVDSITGNGSIGNIRVGNLTWLESLKYIGHLYIFNISGLTDLHDLDSLRKIEGGITISSQANMVSLSGLSALKSVGGEISISNNPLLANGVGLDSLESVGSGIFVENNPLLSGLHFLHKIDSIKGDLILDGNNALIDLNGLDSMRVIEGNVTIQNNGNLQSFHGLDSLNLINGSIILSTNNLLEDIEAIRNVNPGEIDDITIENSPLLSECAIESICGFLSALGTATISNNAIGCNSIEEINAACLVGIHDSTFDQEISISPNPTTGLIDVSYPGSESGLIRLFDYQGYELSKIPASNAFIDLSAFQPGMYFLIFEADTQRFLSRVIKI